MRHIAGLVNSDPGPTRITVNGRTVQAQGRAVRDIRRLRREVGFIFQQFNLVGRLSLLENVLVGSLSRTPWYRRLVRWFTRHEQREAMQALAFVGMSEFAAQRASTLSGGQQQRGAVARTIVQRAQVVLADEPIASLDPNSAHLVMQGLQRMNQAEGVTVVVSVHQLDFAMRYCSRMVAMNDGRIAADCAVQELDQEQLRSIYGEGFEDFEMSPRTDNVPSQERRGQDVPAAEARAGA
jgi:phosphonate transport system ATP-binding protein